MPPFAEDARNAIDDPPAAAPLVSALATMPDEADAREECHEGDGEFKCDSDKGDGNKEGGHFVPMWIAASRRYPLELRH